ncbi:hypothetical protein B0H11DRAFT_452455 [Mycena galericulata]|nr:hypothetical protein B0H11DRAFT_452455 [Mycena galericulata]
MFSKNHAEIDPCDYFDMIGGSGTGGIIALMLGRLRMSIDDAILAYDHVCAKFFANANRDGAESQFDAESFETVLKELTESSLPSGNPNEQMMDPQTQSGACRTFVCTRKMHVEADSTTPLLLRTYESPGSPATTCTIWQAARATSAAPIFFPPVKVEFEDQTASFIDGGTGHYNPTPDLLQEAKIIFPGRRLRCLINIGFNTSNTLDSASRDTQFTPKFVQAMVEITNDCSKTANRSAPRSRDIYYRFSVVGQQPVEIGMWDDVKEIAKLVRPYLDDYKAGLGILPRTPRTTCPAPNKFFRGRQDILANMRAYFFQNQGQRHVCLLHGQSGCGKTETALKFVAMMSARSELRFCDVYFVDASNRSSVESGLREIAKSRDQSLDSLELSKSEKEWLIIFDNVVDPTLNIKDFLPDCPHGNIILTSTIQELIRGAQMSEASFEVSAMNPADAATLLITMAELPTSAENQQIAQAIVKKLGCMPLAISLAGRYVALGHPMADFLKKYEATDIELRKDETVLRNDETKQWPTYTAFQMNLVTLDQPSTQFLQYCTVIHHAQIPVVLFESAAQFIIQKDRYKRSWQSNPEFKHLQTFWTSDPIALLQKTVSDLRDHAIIEQKVNFLTFTIHPLIQHWIRSSLTSKETQSVQASMEIMISSALSSNGAQDMEFLRTIIPHATGFVESHGLRQPELATAEEKLAYESRDIEDLKKLHQSQPVSQDHPAVSTETAETINDFKIELQRSPAYRGDAVDQETLQALHALAHRLEHHLGRPDIAEEILAAIVGQGGITLAEPEMLVRHFSRLYEREVRIQSFLQPFQKFFRIKSLGGGFTNSVDSGTRAESSGQGTASPSTGRLDGPTVATRLSPSNVNAGPSHSPTPSASMLQPSSDQASSSSSRPVLVEPPGFNSESGISTFIIYSPKSSDNTPDIIRRHGTSPEILDDLHVLKNQYSGGGSIVSIHSPDKAVLWIESHYDSPLVHAIRSRGFGGPIAAMLSPEEPALVIFGSIHDSWVLKAAKLLSDISQFAVMIRPLRHNPVPLGAAETHSKLPTRGHSPNVRPSISWRRVGSTREDFEQESESDEASTERTDRGEGAASDDSDGMDQSTRTGGVFRLRGGADKNDFTPWMSPVHHVDVHLEFKVQREFEAENRTGWRPQAVSWTRFYVALPEDGNVSTDRSYSNIRFLVEKQYISDCMKMECSGFIPPEKTTKTADTTSKQTTKSISFAAGAKPVGNLGYARNDTTTKVVERQNDRATPKCEVKYKPGKGLTNLGGTSFESFNVSYEAADDLETDTKYPLHAEFSMGINVGNPDDVNVFHSCLTFA